MTCIGVHYTFSHSIGSLTLMKLFVYRSHDLCAGLYNNNVCSNASVHATVQLKFLFSMRDKSYCNKVVGEYNTHVHTLQVNISINISVHLRNVVHDL